MTFHHGLGRLRERLRLPFNPRVHARAVFLAAALFLVGMGSSFKLNGVRYALMPYGPVLLILSIVLILRQPGLAN